MRNNYEVRGDFAAIWCKDYDGVWWEALVDIEDIEPLSAAVNWRINRTGYAIGRVAGKTRQMHRFLMGESAPMYDHKNRDKLDNRKENLRTATKSQNAANSRITTRKASRYKGVTVGKRSWVAKIICNNEDHQLGCYQSEVDAAKAYDAAARFLFGEYAYCNFPDETTKASPAEIRGRRAEFFKARASSKYKGVGYHKGRGRWRAFVRINGKSKDIGFFKTEAEAAAAVQRHHAYSPLAIAV